MPRAIRLGRMLEEFNLTWFEEPIRYDDHAGEAEIAAALATPIASGETEYTSRGMHEMLRLRSADILMPDLQRMGGPTEFLKAAQLAEAYNTPVSSHLFPEMNRVADWPPCRTRCTSNTCRGANRPMPSASSSTRKAAPSCRTSPAGASPSIRPRSSDTRHSIPVMAGLVPAIHVFHARSADVDARHKAGQDELSTGGEAIPAGYRIDWPTAFHRTLAPGFDAPTLAA